jgi:hypothetical protein
MTSKERAGIRILGTLRTDARWDELQPAYDDLAANAGQ